jgi:hypothetical protein
MVAIFAMIAAVPVPKQSLNLPIGFKDATGTHAESRSPITLSILPGDPNLPTPTPKPTVTPTKKPTTDGCRNQIKN